MILFSFPLILGGDGGGGGGGGGIPTPEPTPIPNGDGIWQQLADATLTACVNTFSSDVTYITKDEDEFAIKGVFDRAFVDVEVLDGAAIQSTRPRLLIRTEDLDGWVPTRGDTCVINGITYRVDEYQRDIEAGAVLFLDEA